MMQVGDSVKVTKLSGEYAKYCTRPGREGIILEIEDRCVQVKFLAVSPSHKNHQDIQKALLYYEYTHYFYPQDLKVTHHRAGSNIAKMLQGLRDRAKIAQPVSSKRKGQLLLNIF